MITDEQDNKDLSKYLAGNSPVKAKARTGGLTSKSPMRGLPDSSTFTGAASFKNVGSPAKVESQKFQNLQNNGQKGQQEQTMREEQEKKERERMQREADLRKQEEQQREIE